MILENTGRFFLWGVRRIGLESLLKFILLIMIFGSIIAGLDSILRDFEGVISGFSTLLALITGWILAKSSISGWKAGLWAAVIGVIVLFASIGHLGSKLLLLSQATFSWVWEFLIKQPDAPLPDSSFLVLLLQDFGFRITSLLNQINAWMWYLLQRIPHYNPTAINILWGIALWIAAVWAGWALRRYEKPLIAVLPAVVLFASSLSFVRAEMAYLLPVLGAALLLVALTNYSTNRDRWIRTNTDYSEEIQLDLVIWVLVLSFGLILSAWMISTISPQRIYRFARRVIQNQPAQIKEIGESLGLEQGYSNQDYFSSVGFAGLPRDHLIGSGPELNSQLVMTVKINEPQNRGYERPNNHPNPPFYWRVLNYDIYTGHGWVTSPTDIQIYQANEPIITESPPYHTVIDQEVNLFDEQDTLTYHTGSLVMADREYEVAWRVGPKDRGDYLGSTISGNNYHLKSIIPLVAESQLRSTVEVYPQWIYDRYLALPEEVPQRVKDLAYEVTSGANSPYDKAYAIEQYLRGFPYTLAVPVPPTEQDIADFFLFDLQKGYCDYYATTMVVMARSTGLPARLVMGYAQGDYDENIEGFVVTEADAHSWVEVYFSEVGWIEFEPTAGLPAIERPERIELLAPVELITFEPPATQFNLPDWPRGLGLIGVLIALASIILIVWMMSDTWRLSRRSPTDVLSSLYRRLYHQAMHLDLPPEPGDTPYEFVSSFSRQVNTKAEGKPWEEWLLPAGPEAHQLINLYVHSFYSAHPPQELHKIQALQIWRRLRHRLWLIRFR